MLSNIDKNGMLGDIPAWMKELRLRRRNRQLHNNIESPQTSSTSSSSSVTIGGVTVQQPSSTSRCHTATSNSISCAVNINKGRVKCNNTDKMVQERPWIDHADQLIEKIEGAEKGEDSDSSEELKYGPGIVSKLKNRYLSLTLREAATKTRPSILNLRKATSLEHILDDYEVEEDKFEKDDESKTNRLYERHNGTGTTKNITNRYSKHATKKTDMKRARSVEIISSLENDNLLTNDVKTKRESLHEEMLIIEGNDKTCNTTDKKMFQIEDNKNFSNNIGLRLNRPRRIQPMMDEKEKPHADIVKQTKKIFERPELRTKPPQCTGEVAAKVAEFRTIIDSTKTSNKKPPIKQKPPHVEKVAISDRPKVQIKREISTEKQTQIGSPIPPLRSPIKEYKPEVKENIVTSLPTPPVIPDVSKVGTPTEETNGFANSSLSETPDLILHSSHDRTEQIEHFLEAEKEQGTVEHKNKINIEKSKEFETPSNQDSRAKLKVNNVHQDKINLENSIIYSFSSPTKIKDHLPKIEAPSKVIKSENNVSETSKNEQVSPIKPKEDSAHLVENIMAKKNMDNLNANKPIQQNVFSPKSSPKNSPKISPRSPPKSLPGSPKSSPISHTTPTSAPIPPKSSLSPPRSSPSSPKSSPSPPKSPSKHVANGVPVTEPLKVEINGSFSDSINNRISAKQNNSEPVLLKTQPSSPVKEKTALSVPQKHLKNNEIASESRNNGVGKLSDKVIEKNLKNAPNLMETPNTLSSSVVTTTYKSENGVLKTNEVPNLKKKRPSVRKEPQNSLVFDFTSRKDVPDYIGNDRCIKPKEKIERPKPGEGGIIILPGATLDESLVDDDEDWKKLLECPPSPCNVTFTNDNIVIGGRSSLKKLKKPKMTIRFIEANPEVFEYLSETSQLEDNHSSSVGHAVPSLSGSTLANYTPKSAFQTEEFQLGMKPSLPTPSPSESKQTEDVPEEPVILQEAPILFSAGTNSDILF